MEEVRLRKVREVKKVRKVREVKNVRKLGGIKWSVAVPELLVWIRYSCNFDVSVTMAPLSDVLLPICWCEEGLVSDAIFINYSYPDLSSEGQN